MKVESDLKPVNSFDIENIQNGKCDVVFYTNIKEKETESQEENKKAIIYEYEIYRINVDYREGIKEKIKSSYQKWLDFAKKVESDELAKEIREKRNKLLEETDKEMCLDRLDLKLPTDLTMTNIISGLKQFFDGFSNIFNGDMAKYRQELRDITKQEGFPYNVRFPNKPIIETKKTTKV